MVEGGLAVRLSNGHGREEREGSMRNRRGSKVATKPTRRSNGRRRQWRRSERGEVVSGQRGVLVLVWMVVVMMRVRLRLRWRLLLGGV